MAQRHGKKEKKGKIDATDIIKRQFRSLRLLTAAVFLIALTINIVVFTQIVGAGRDTSEWLLGAVVSSGLIFLFGVIVLANLGVNETRLSQLTRIAIEGEVGQLRAATKRAETLQEMAATMRSTLNLKKVVESAIDVCAVTLEEMSIPETSMVAGVFLYNDTETLAPVAERRLNSRPKQTLAGEVGIVAEALQYGEVAVSATPKTEVELYEFPGFRKCRSVVVIPLRVAFQIYGVIVVGTDVQVNFDKRQLETFSSVGDQAVLALRNAQLYENLELEKERLLAAENEARNQLARDLHDGPTQSVAAIAMRINFIRTMMKHDPSGVIEELTKVEELAKRTGREIRGMLFTLRPLVLEAQGLSAAIETFMERLRESDDINVRLAGGEYGELLTPRAQGVIFYMVEEALGNARKHSQASAIEVRFWQEDGLFVARIQDNGVGFDVNEVMSDYSSRGSLGMVNLRERAESINGSVRVESTIGKGTSITIVVPLDKQGLMSNKN